MELSLTQNKAVFLQFMQADSRTMEKVLDVPCVGEARLKLASMRGICVRLATKSRRRKEN